MDPLFWIAFVMLLSGALGGLVNFFISDATQDKPLMWHQHVFIGIVAAFIVPLFLNMASGDLIDRIRGVDGKAPDFSRLFVLAGFCLLAAASSRAFIRSLSERVLQEVRAANRKADAAMHEASEAQAAVAPLVEDDKPNEVEGPSREGSNEAAGIQANVPKFELSDPEQKVLNAMANSGFSMRSITGIAHDSGLLRAQVSMILNSLVAKDLVVQGKSSKSDQPRWSLTSTARAILSANR